MKELINNLIGKLKSLISLYKFFGTKPNYRNPYVHAPNKQENETPSYCECNLENNDDCDTEN